ncbi:MAG: glycosyltransferase, partial [Deltaproteobacteria bacterium]|nr:glycosyltransferase [Deltaproteobacteria bacterium]
MRVLYFNPQPLSPVPEDQDFVALLREAARQHQVSLIQVVPGGEVGRYRLSALRSVVQEFVELGPPPAGLVLPMMQASETDDAAFEYLDERRLDLYLETFERELGRLAGRLRPDLVHVNYLWLGAAMARSVLPSTPVVVSAHDLDLVLAERTPGLARRVTPPARELQRVFAATSGSAKAVGRVHGIRSDRLQIVGRGVDTLRFHPPETTASAAFAQVVEEHTLRLPRRPALRIVYLGSAGDPGLPALITVLRRLCPVGGGVIAVLLVEGAPAAVRALREGIPTDAEIYTLNQPTSGVRAGLFRGSHLVVPRGVSTFVLQRAVEAVACGCRVNLVDDPALGVWPPAEFARGGG